MLGRLLDDGARNGLCDLLGDVRRHACFAEALAGLVSSVAGSSRYTLAVRVVREPELEER